MARASVCVVGRERMLLRRGVRLDVANAPFWLTAVFVVALTAISLWIRTRVLGAGFWIDEGLSVGIAHHPFTSIPHLLRQDG